MAKPNDALPADAKKRFLLTAGFDDQLTLMAPEPEAVPIPARRWPGAPELPPPPPPAEPLPAVHRFVSAPEAHPAWSEIVQRGLALEMPPWQTQVFLRMALVALHGRDATMRHDALGRLCADLDAYLRPTSTLMVGPLRHDAPNTSSLAGPNPPGVALFAGLDFPEASPAAQASLFAALTGWAASNAPRVQLYGALDVAPLDLVHAVASALHRDIDHIPIPSPPWPSDAPALTSGLLISELHAAHALAATPAEAIWCLPALIANAPIPAARLAFMRIYATAMREVYFLPEPIPNSPGLLSQITARLASPLRAIYATSLQELDALAALPDPAALGLDLPSRYPTALPTALTALAANKPVPRWVIANTHGGDRSLLSATLLGRLPSADPHLLDALVGLAPPELEPALHETLREHWPPSPAKSAARATLRSLGRIA